MTTNNKKYKIVNPVVENKDKDFYKTDFIDKINDIAKNWRQSIYTNDIDNEKNLKINGKRVMDGKKLHEERIMKDYIIPLSYLIYSYIYTKYSDYQFKKNIFHQNKLNYDMYKYFFDKDNPIIKKINVFIYKQDKELQKNKTKYLIDIKSIGDVKTTIKDFFNITINQVNFIKDDNTDILVNDFESCIIKLNKIVKFFNDFNKNIINLYIDDVIKAVSNLGKRLTPPINLTQDNINATKIVIENEIKRITSPPPTSITVATLVENLAKTRARVVATPAIARVVAKAVKKEVEKIPIPEILNNGFNIKNSKSIPRNNINNLIKKGKIKEDEKDYSWNSLYTTTNILNHIAISYDSSIIIGISNDNIYSTNDSGVNWIDTNLKDLKSKEIAISYDGKIQKIIRDHDSSGNIYFSNDYGEKNSWENYDIDVLALPPKIELSHICISKTGDVQTISDSSGNIYISDNYGEQFEKITTIANIQKIVMSENGEIQALITDGEIHISDNYGKKWIKKYTVPSIKDISISEDGEYISIITTDKVYISNNYGTSFKEIDPNLFTTIPSPTLLANFLSITMTKDGKNQTILNTAGRNSTIISSNNYGKKWIILLEDTLALNLKSLIYGEDESILIAYNDNTIYKLNFMNKYTGSDYTFGDKNFKELFDELDKFMKKTNYIYGDEKFQEDYKKASEIYVDLLKKVGEINQNENIINTKFYLREEDINLDTIFNEYFKYKKLLDKKKVLEDKKITMIKYSKNISNEFKIQILDYTDLFEKIATDDNKDKINLENINNSYDIIRKNIINLYNIINPKNIITQIDEDIIKIIIERTVKLFDNNNFDNNNFYNLFFVLIFMNQEIENTYINNIGGNNKKETLTVEMMNDYKEKFNTYSRLFINRKPDIKDFTKIYEKKLVLIKSEYPNNEEGMTGGDGGKNKSKPLKSTSKSKTSSMSKDSSTSKSTSTSKDSSTEKVSKNSEDTTKITNLNEDIKKNEGKIKECNDFIKIYENKISKGTLDGSENFTSKLKNNTVTLSCHIKKTGDKLIDIDVNSELDKFLNEINLTTINSSKYEYHNAISASLTARAELAKVGNIDTDIYDTSINLSNYNKKSIFIGNKIKIDGKSIDIDNILTQYLSIITDKLPDNKMSKIDDIKNTIYKYILQNITLNLANKNKSPVITEIKLTNITPKLDDFEKYFIDNINNIKVTSEDQNSTFKKELNLLTSKKLLKDNEITLTLERTKIFKKIKTDLDEKIKDPTKIEKYSENYIINDDAKRISLDNNLKNIINTTTIYEENIEKMVFDRSLNKFTFEYNKNKDFTEIITKINDLDKLSSNNVKIKEEIQEVTKKINEYFLSEKANNDIIPDIFKENNKNQELNQQIQGFFKKYKELFSNLVIKIKNILERINITCINDKAAKKIMIDNFKERIIKNKSKFIENINTNEEDYETKFFKNNIKKGNMTEVLLYTNKLLSYNINLLTIIDYLLFFYN